MQETRPDSAERQASHASPAPAARTPPPLRPFRLVLPDPSRPNQPAEASHRAADGPSGSNATAGTVTSATPTMLPGDSSNLPDAEPAQPTEHASGPPRRTATLDCDRILDATAHCIDELGYDDTTIRKIAKHLGCAVGSIYRYFTDKRELLSGVTQRRFEPVLVFSTGGGPVDDAEVLYERAALEQPEQYRLMFWLSIVGPSKTAANKARREADKKPARAQADGVELSETDDGVDTAATFPTMIADIIDAWADQLGSVDAARERWTRLHGRIMLGELADAPDAEQREADAARRRRLDPVINASNDDLPRPD